MTRCTPVRSVPTRSSRSSRSAVRPSSAVSVWALEGFGAANILQEILTIKSDDVMGRAKAYEAIVKGENLPKPGIPEAMNVLLHELRGLALSVKLE